MTAAQEAHLRLLHAGLPKRSHEWSPAKRVPTGRAAALPEWKVQRMRELDGTMPRRAICALLQVSHVTLVRKLGRRNAVRK